MLSVSEQPRLLRVAGSVAVRELRAGSRSRWVGGALVVLAGAAGGSALLARTGTGDVGFDGMAPIAAGLLVVLFWLVPLLGFVLGGLAVAADRESRLLELVAVQPASISAYVWGRLAGLWATLAAGVVGGVGVAAFVLAPVLGTSDAGRLALLALLSLVTGGACIAVGMAVSSLAHERLQGLGYALGAWLALTVVWDTVVIVASSRLALGPRAVVALVVLNPVDAGRTLAVTLLDPSLGSLGSVGVWLQDSLGTSGFVVLAAGVQLAWIVAAASLAAAAAGRRPLTGGRHR